MVKTNTVMLSVALAIHNEAANIARCLRSVSGLADEIIVVDGASTDGSAELAKTLGAVVHPAGNPAMFHINKQKALEQCRGTWILQLDADEEVDAALASEIRRAISSKGAHDGYYIPRRNYFLGDWLRKGGQYPDYVIRLFKNGKGAFPRKSVHEQIAIDGSVGHLKQPLNHYSYTSIGQYWSKASAYIRLMADELKASGKAGGITGFMAYVVFKPAVTFLALYFRHKGFVDGWRGFLFALFSAMHFPKAYFLSVHKTNES